MLKEDRVAWLHSPITQDLIARITQQREGIKEEWANGVYLGDGAIMEALGSVKALEIAISLIEETGGKDE